MPSAERGNVCPKCERDIGKGAAQRFKDFLDELVPDRSEFAKPRNHLYRLRSDISHGWDLFGRDLKDSMNPKSSDQDDVNLGCIQPSENCSGELLKQASKSEIPFRAASALAEDERAM